MDLRQSTSPSSASDPMTSWYSSLSLAKKRISLLSSLIQDQAAGETISSLSDSSNPSLSLLTSPSAYAAVSLSLSGSSTDPLCHWLYDTYLSSDPSLRLVVLSFVPFLSHLYLSSLSSSSHPHRSLAGFEAVFLSLYADEVRSRSGNPVLVNIPDLSRPSLYHSPRPVPNPNPRFAKSRPELSVGVVSPPLEPQTAVKSTKRACIVGVALDCYFKQVSQMPFWSKLDFCRFVAEWAGQDCPCRDEFDRTEGEIVVREMGSLGICENGKDGDIGSLQIRGNGTIGENREMGCLEIRENGQNGDMGSLEIRGNGQNGDMGSLEIRGNGQNGDMGSLEIRGNGQNGDMGSLEIRGNGERGILRISENGRNGENGEMGILRIGENGENGEMGSLEIRENGINEQNGETGNLQTTDNGGKEQNGIGPGARGGRIALPWEILQPVLRILGHCLLAPLNVAEVKEAAGVAVRAIYARASHELAPQAILAARSLIQLDKRAREAERAAMVASASSKVNTPSKAKRPEMLLVSK